MAVAMVNGHRDVVFGFGFSFFNVPPLFPPIRIFGRAIISFERQNYIRRRTDNRSTHWRIRRRTDKISTHYLANSSTDRQPFNSLANLLMDRQHRYQRREYPATHQ